MLGAPLRILHPVGKVDAAHPGLGGELDEAAAVGGFELEREILARQLDDALAFRRRVGQRSHRGQPRQLALERALHGHEQGRRRLPSVIVPVLSSSSVSTSPATSTALPLLAIRLAASARSMPAIPIAASRAPMVVGIRQTRSAIKVGMSRRDAEVASHRDRASP